MTQPNRHLFQSEGIVQDLLLAIKKLENYIQLKETKPSSNIHLEKQNEVLKAIELVKKNAEIIQKFTEGNLIQKQLASSVMAVVDRYNTMTAASPAFQKKLSSRWTFRLAQFFYEKLNFLNSRHFEAEKVELIEKIPVKEDSSKNNLINKLSVFENPETISSSKKITSLVKKQEKQPNFPDILIQEEDAFRMKAITLLRNHGIRFSSISETLKSVRISPIFTTSMSSLASPTSPNSIISLSQTLTPFPGEVVVLKGSFKRSVKPNQHSIPIPESFHLSSQSVQTGFPHPSQHSGWALANQLTLTSLVGDSKHLKFWSYFHGRKQEVSQALLPKGRLIDKAKTLLILKKQVFEENRQEFLALHKELTLAIISAAPANIVDPNIETAVFLYYQAIEQHPSVYHYISDIHQLIIDHFIAEPYEKLKIEWEKHLKPAFSFSNPQILYSKALQFLEQIQIETKQAFLIPKDHSLSPLEKHTFDYIACIGELISTATNILILQKFSKIMGFPAPVLNHFERKIQVASYKQLHGFIEELEEIDLSNDSKTNSKNMHDILKRHLESDISLFKSEIWERLDGPYIKVADELEKFYSEE